MILRHKGNNNFEKLATFKNSLFKVRMYWHLMCLKWYYVTHIVFGNLGIFT